MISLDSVDSAVFLDNEISDPQTVDPGTVHTASRSEACDETEEIAETVNTETQLQASTKNISLVETENVDYEEVKEDIIQMVTEENTSLDLECSPGINSEILSDTKTEIDIASLSHITNDADRNEPPPKTPKLEADEPQTTPNPKPNDDFEETTHITQDPEPCMPLASAKENTVSDKPAFELETSITQMIEELFDDNTVQSLGDDPVFSDLQSEEEDSFLQVETREKRSLSTPSEYSQVPKKTERHHDSFTSDPGTGVESGVMRGTSSADEDTFGLFPSSSY